MKTAEQIVEWVRSRGSDTDDLRDAAHEASHALEVLPRRWDRESIHAKISRRPRAFMQATELEARAVERVVCARLGVEHDWAKFEFLAFVEASKSGLWLPKDLGERIVGLMTAPQCIARAETILAAGE